MAVATREQYDEMLDRAKENGFAYPAINVTSSQTATAALRGLAEAESDGILQVSVGGAEYWSGSTVKDRVAGSIAFTEYVRAVAKNYDITVALHTDHCAKQNIDSWVRPLLELEAEQHKAGKETYFNSHMWDGSSVSLKENLEIAKELLELSVKANTILEIEVGVVGGEEDGIVGKIDEKLYTTPEDGLKTVEALGTGEHGRYITALTFGNVHGVYKPGHVKLRPELLEEIQEEVGKKIGKERPFDLVFHGGSGSSPEEIATAVKAGVIKMNIDTDTQYAFTRPIADWMYKNYDGVLKVDGEVGVKKTYDPRSWGKAAEAGMAERVVEAAKQLGSAGNKMK
ncbi:class II fructose-bisphosphate aldolase [Actinobaculum suis]|uniref:class II fructose-bisphosphate aldolase n=1 Tax=Actinobaculum suis TaxID=1657 RepID=UPI0008087E84|nr:class II fructose-bisphosphate aldolase [Actinobaculum suis]OCA95204.1 class II fructose-bisphosphate aldolase [Actinobaculum suis]OCA95625.1 class II fructose-bisphosphate aldolase [Actinobaculum suis]